MREFCSGGFHFQIFYNFLSFSLWLLICLYIYFDSGKTNKNEECIWTSVMDGSHNLESVLPVMFHLQCPILFILVA
jgi:hypothetical protein